MWEIINIGKLFFNKLLKITFSSLSEGHLSNSLKNKSYLDSFDVEVITAICFKEAWIIIIRSLRRTCCSNVPAKHETKISKTPNVPTTKQTNSWLHFKNISSVAIRNMHRFFAFADSKIRLTNQTPTFFKTEKG